MAEKEDSRRTCEHTGWAKEERQKKEIEDVYWDGGFILG